MNIFTWKHELIFFTKVSLIKIVFTVKNKFFPVFRNGHNAVYSVVKRFIFRVIFSVSGAG